VLLVIAAGPSASTPRKIRVGICVAYLATALFLGDWASYTETMYEVVNREMPTALYAIPAAALMLVVASLVVFFNPRMSAKIGILGSLVALPYCLLAAVNTHWAFTLNNHAGQVSREGSIIMVGFTAILSTIRLRST
jgi:hypothetical protein